MNQYLHCGHSSVKVDSKGTLWEVRRGPQLFSAIADPKQWNSAEEWMRYADSLVMPIVGSQHWTSDQKWLSQWFKHETMRYVNTHPLSWKSVIQQLQDLHYQMRRKPSLKVHEKLTYMEQLHNDMLHVSRTNCPYIIQTISPKMMVEDQYGHLHALHMCLSTGAIAIDSEKNIGRSFSELGILPRAIYNREFKVYYRVL